MIDPSGAPKMRGGSVQVLEVESGN